MERAERKRLRLPEYDYSQAGSYFITVCAAGRQTLLWNAVGADIIRPDTLPLSASGMIVEQAILDIPAYYPQVTLHKWVVMPNHIHLLLQINETDGRMISAPTRTISTMIGQMKRAASKAAGGPIWQRGFYDHVVRNENDFLRIWTYIDANPAKWAEDRYYVRVPV
nr:transposase [uncultured Oscillibacter sp.]